MLTRVDLLHPAAHLNCMAATTWYEVPGTAVDTLVAAYLRESNAYPADTWVILPVNRLAGTIREQITKRGAACIPSRITTVAEFAETVTTAIFPEMRIVSSLEQNLIFSWIVQHNQSILHLFPEKKPGLSAVEDLVTLYDTLAYQCAVLPEGGEKLTALSSVFREYDRFCEKERLADPPRILALATTAVRSGRFPLKMVFLYGMFAPKELEAKVLDAVVLAAGQIEEFVPHANNDKIFPRRTVPTEEHSVATKLAETIFQRLTITPDLPIKKIGVFPNRIRELSAVAEEICVLIDAGVQPGDIAILTPEVPLTVEIAGELFPDFVAGSRTLKFTSSLGHPLFRYPAVSAAFSVLKTVIGNYTTADMTTLFSYPYFSWGEEYLSPRDLTWLARFAEITGGAWQWLSYPESLKKRFQAKCEDPDIPPPEKAELAAKITKIEELTQKLSRVFSLLKPFEERKATAEFTADLRSILSHLNYPRGFSAAGLSSEDASAVNSFTDVLSGLEAAETLLPHEVMSPGALYARLFSLVKSAQNNMPSPYADEDTVKILGLREVVHQHIPHIFLTGLTADAIPRVHPRLPFLTIAETFAAKTQTYEDTLREERYAFLAALLCAEKSIYLSAPSSDEGTTKIPSPWLEMFCVPDTAWIVPELRHSGTWLAEHAGRLIAGGTWEEGLVLPECLDLGDAARRIGIEAVDRAGIPTGEYDAVFSGLPLRNRFGERYRADTEYSVTELERYAACPFRWYIELHLRLTPMPDPESDERPELGNVIHKTMYRLITESAYFPPDRETKDAALADLRRIAVEEFEKINLTTPKWQSLKNQYVGTNQYPGRLAEVIELEIAIAETGFTSPPELLEYAFSFEETPGIPLDNGENLRLQGRVDRIQMSGTAFVVTDYKTGQAKKTADIHAGRSLQLPLYLAALSHLHPDRKGVDGTYYQISPKTVKETRPLKDEQDCGIAASLAHAARYRNGMREGICAPSFHQDICAYCKEKAICRFDKLRSLAGGT